MSYLQIVQTGIAIFPLVALIFTIPFVVYNYKKYKVVNHYRAFVLYSMILYLICAYFMVILPLPSIESVRQLTTARMQLKPFCFVTCFINCSGIVFSNPSTYIPALKSFAFLQAAFNVLLTVPFGFYLRYYFKCSFKKTALFSFLFSLFFELTQLSGLYFIYPRPYRLFDVDDLILNTTGGILGFLFCGLFKNILPKIEKTCNTIERMSDKFVGIKRIAVFALDFVFCLVISAFASFASNMESYIVIAAILFVWTGIVPLFMGGRTISGGFFNLKVSAENKFMIPLRAFFVELNFLVIPELIFELVNYIVLTHGADSRWLIPLGGICIIVLPMYYLLCISGLVFRNTAFYDKFFNCLVMSETKTQV